MNTDGQRGLEHSLTEAGERWRANQPGPPEPDLPRLAGVGAHTPHRWARTRIWLPVAAVVGVATVIAFVAVPLALSRIDSAAPDVAVPSAMGGAPTGPSPEPVTTLPPDQGAGVPVEGTGTLLRDRDGVTRLCAGVAVTDDVPTSGASCSPVFVRTSAVDPARLVHTTTGGQAYSDPVRVEGGYHEGTLAVTHVVM